MIFLSGFQHLSQLVISKILNWDIFCRSIYDYFFSGFWNFMFFFSRTHWTLQYLVLATSEQQQTLWTAGDRLEEVFISLRERLLSSVSKCADHISVSVPLSSEERINGALTHLHTSSTFCNAVMQFINIDRWAEMAGINPTGTSCGWWKIMGEYTDYRKQIKVLTPTVLIEGKEAQNRSCRWCVCNGYNICNLNIGCSKCVCVINMFVCCILSHYHIYACAKKNTRIDLWLRALDCL